MKLKRTVALPTLMGVCLLFAGCSQAPDGSTPPAGPAVVTPATADVDVTRVVSQKLNTMVKLPAQLTAYEMVDVYPKVAGFIK